MAVSHISVIVSRAMAADEDSPIAVFMTKDKLLRAVFANTVETYKRIRAGDRNLVGVFHGRMFAKDIRERLQKASPKAVRKEAEWREEQATRRGRK